MVQFIDIPALSYFRESDIGGILVISELILILYRWFAEFPEVASALPHP